MAEETPASDSAPKGKSKKMLIIIVAVVLLLVLGGVGAFLALGSKGGEEGEDLEGEEGFEEEGEEGQEGEEGAEGAILPLETFIVNLQVKGSFLKATIQLGFGEPEVPKSVEAAVPKMRDRIIAILSSKASSELLTVEGKDKLREEILEAANEILGGEDVIEVYFTEFIIQ